MKSHNWNMWSIISVLIVLLSLASFSEARADRSKISELRCFNCVEYGCLNIDWTKNDPKNCTTDDLLVENMGPALLRNLTHIPYSSLHGEIPEFVCQKVVVYTVRGGPEGGRVELRRCALRLNGNQTCDRFYENQDRFAKDLFLNSTCEVCDKDSCNSGTFNYIWIPLLFTSIISCLLMN